MVSQQSETFFHPQLNSLALFVSVVIYHKWLVDHCILYVDDQIDGRPSNSNGASNILTVFDQCSRIDCVANMFDRPISIVVSLPQKIQQGNVWVANKCRFDCLVEDIFRSHRQLCLKNKSVQFWEMFTMVETLFDLGKRIDIEQTYSMTLLTMADKCKNT